MEQLEVVELLPLESSTDRVASKRLGRVKETERA
jgi:hypothetical protein